MDTLGIDLAKRSFDATLLRADGSRVHELFTNDATGFTALQHWLAKAAVSELHICMEATNVYWQALAGVLHALGFTVSVVNPARIKGFAMAEMQRSKTDKLDSFIIASFCAKHQPQAWTPPSQAHATLRALARHRDDLIQTRIQQQNRLQTTTEPRVRSSLEAVIALVEQQIASVDELIGEHVAAAAELQSSVALMATVAGIGLVTAHKLLADYGDIAAYESARALTADAGLTPSVYESGTSVRRRPRLSKMGKASVRAALWWPAITAMNRCDAFKQFAQRLFDRGKPKMVVIAAVMRKLLHVVYGVLKHQTPFDPAKVLGKSAPQRTI